MALLAKVGSLATPNATGNVGYTGVGFQPDAVIFFGNGCAADETTGSNTADNKMPLSFGFGAGTGEGMLADDDDFTAGNPLCDTGALIYDFYGNGGAGTVRAAADLISLDSDGFTLHWSIATSGYNAIKNYLALGGPELQASLTHPTVPGATGSWAITGAGFAPDAAIILLGSSTSGLTETGGFGFVSKATQQNAASSAFLASATVYERTDQAIVNIKGSTKLFEASLTSFDADGMTLNVTTRGTYGTAPVCSILWLKGVNIRSDHETQKTSTGTQAYAGYGFQPKALLLGSVLKTPSTTLDALGVNWTFGATDGTNRATIMKLSNNNGNHVLDRTKLYKVTDDQASFLSVIASADLSSFDADGFTLNYSIADAVAREFLVMAFGDPAGAPAAPQAPAPGLHAGRFGPF